jgi:pantothenate kinase
VLDRVHRLAAGPDRRVLGIVGAPGAGKSTLAAAIGERCEQDHPGRVAVVGMDGWHLANSTLSRLGRLERKGAPDTFDPAGYLALLRRLRHPDGDVVYAPRFDRHLEEAIAGAVAVQPTTPLVVTEGNYLLLDEPPWDQIRELLDECWYVEADDELRVEQLVARHVDHGRSLEAAREWVLRSDEANARLVAACRVRAHLVVRR